MKLTRAETARLYELVAQGVRPCRQCGHVLPLSAFHGAKREIGGVVSRCKDCARSHYQANKEQIRERRAEYRTKHRKEILAEKKAYYYAHREECLEQTARYREGRRVEIAARQRAYYQRTLVERRAYEVSRQESRKVYNKAWREAHIIEVTERVGRWRTEHADDLCIARKVWYQENKELSAARSRAYQSTHKEQMREASRRYLQTPEGKAKNRRGVHVRKARVRAVSHTFTVRDWMAVLQQFNHRCAYCGAADVPLEQEHIVPLVQGGGYVVGNIVPVCARCNSSKHTASFAEWVAGRGAAFVDTRAIERVQSYRLGVLGEA